MHPKYHSTEFVLLMACNTAPHPLCSAPPPAPGWMEACSLRVDSPHVPETGVASLLRVTPRSVVH